MKNKQVLITELMKEINNISLNKKDVQRCTELLRDKYDVPMGVSADFLTGNRFDLENLPDNVLYYFVSVILPSKVSEYTAAEIKKYEKTKYIKETIKFPIKIPMIQIGQDHWVGKIDVAFLMQLKKAQLINYNENAQRTLERKISNGVEYYRIALNNKSVEEIIKSFENDSYIPNTITLNISEDSDFYYNEETAHFIIKELKHFDILDGYHRYIAMSRIFQTNPKFNYEMELRIVCFNNEKARQFIWQEDQKTKMKKVDSDSFNQNNPANQIVTMLNDITEFKGMFNKKDTIIDTGFASRLISVLYFNNSYETYNRKRIIDVRDFIASRLRIIINKKTFLYSERWSIQEIAVIFYLISRDDIQDKDLCKKIDNFIKITSDEEYKYLFANRNYTKKHITRLEKVYEEKIK